MQNSLCNAIVVKASLTFLLLKFQNKKVIALVFALGLIVISFSIRKITERSRNVCIREVIESELFIGLSDVKCWENPQDNSEIKKYLSKLRTNNPSQKYELNDFTSQSIWTSIYYGSISPTYVYPLQRDLINPFASNVTSMLSNLGDSVNFGIRQNCRQLSLLVLKSSFENAPSNNGDYVTKVLTQNVEFYRYPGDFFKTFSRYVISISNTGQISEGWWTSPRSNEGHMYRDKTLDKQPGNFPEPTMKSNNGIVCNLSITTAQDSKTFLGEDVSNVIIWATGKDAVLSQDGSGYKVKY